MYVRLAFAVAAHLEPEILIVDEVLAVGDAEFQKKCLGKMKDVADHGRTILFVSHNMQAVANLCTRAILLQNGKLQSIGKTGDIIKQYQNGFTHLEIDEKTSINDEKYRRGNGEVRISQIKYLDSNHQDSVEFEMDKDVFINITCVVLQKIKSLTLSFALRSSEKGEFVCSTERHCISLSDSEKNLRLCLKIPKINLRPGEYSVYCMLGDIKGNPYDVIDGLTAPIVITTKKTFEELGYNPTHKTGYFTLSSSIV